MDAQTEVWTPESKMRAALIEHPTQSGLEALFEMGEESEGTQRMIDLIAALISLLNSKKVLLIDELERSLHPRLTKNLLELFLTHSKESQLIVTTHESMPLS